MNPAHAMAARPYDVIVIGAGPTGENLAHRAVKAGLGAVVVESELVGGECSYWACMPSKALLPLQALAEARAVAGARASCAGTLDVPAILARRDGFAAHWNDARQAKWLEESGIDLVRGHGRVAGERRVTVTDQGGATVDLTARHAVAVCTGSRAAIPPIPGLADARPWTSREATSAKRAPRRLAILGGGVVGCEMATAWRQLGTEELTIIQRGPRLIPGYEAFACEMLRDALEGLGVRVLTGTTAQRVERDARWGCASSWRAERRSRPTRCSWRRAARPEPMTSGSRASAWSRGRGSRWTTACASRRWPEGGSTPRAT